MTYSWVQFLKLAEDLFKDAPTYGYPEACYRSAISRAYYAAFCQSRDFLRTDTRHRLFIPQTPEAHSIVYEEFEDGPNQDYKSIAINLMRLRKDRNRADYNDSVAKLPDITKKAIEHAQQVINKLKRL